MAAQSAKMAAMSENIVKMKKINGILRMRVSREMARNASRVAALASAQNIAPRRNRAWRALAHKKRCA